MIEPLNPFVPERLRPIGQMGPKFLLVNTTDTGQASLSKHLEEIVVFKFPNGRDLEVQQGILPRVHIHRVDVIGCGQRVIQRIAPGRRDDQDVVFRAILQGHSVQAGVFPACVVNQIVPVNRVEDPLAEPVEY